MTNFIYSALIVVVMGVVVFFTRAIPVIFFSSSEKTPEFISYLGKVLPPAVMGMLIIYCLKEVSILDFPFGLPEIIAIISVILAHLKFKNNLISIFGGTVFYMFLIQFIFTWQIFLSGFLFLNTFIAYMIENYFIRAYFVVRKIWLLCFDNIEFIYEQ